MFKDMELLGVSIFGRGKIVSSGMKKRKRKKRNKSPPISRTGGTKKKGTPWKRCGGLTDRRLGQR